MKALIFLALITSNALASDELNRKIEHYDQESQQLNKFYYYGQCIDPDINGLFESMDKDNYQAEMEECEKLVNDRAYLFD